MKLVKTSPFHGSQVAKRALFLAYNAGRVVGMGPFNGGFHVNVTSSHEDAPTELPGFVLMILAHEASKSAV